MTIATVSLLSIISQLLHPCVLHVRTKLEASSSLQDAGYTLETIWYLLAILCAGIWCTSLRWLYPQRNLVFAEYTLCENLVYCSLLSACILIYGQDYDFSCKCSNY